MNVGRRIIEEEWFVFVFVNKRDSLFGKINGGVLKLSDGIFHRLFTVILKTGFEIHDPPVAHKHPMRFTTVVTVRDAKE